MRVFVPRAGTPRNRLRRRHVPTLDRRFARKPDVRMRRGAGGPSRRGQRARVRAQNRRFWRRRPTTGRSSSGTSPETSLETSPAGTFRWRTARDTARRCTGWDGAPTTCWPPSRSTGRASCGTCGAVTRVGSAEDGSGAVCARTLTGHGDDAVGVCFHPRDPRVLATGSDDGTVRVWDLRGTSNGGAVTTLTLHGGREAKRIAFSPKRRDARRGGRRWDVRGRGRVHVGADRHAGGPRGHGVRRGVVAGRQVGRDRVARRVLARVVGVGFEGRTNRRRDLSR